MENLKKIIRENKTTIIVSACTSALTVIILIAAAGVLIVSNKNFVRGKIGALFSGPGIDAANYEATDNESQVVKVVEKSNPAVVSIVITKNVPIIEQYYQEYNPFDDNFFNNFFGNGFGLQVPQYRQKGTEKKEVGGGSGFFISPDGFVVTNRHVVVDGKADYTVLTNDGKKYNAEVLAKDSTLDVAILKVRGGTSSFPYLSFGNSDILKAGQTVIAIGNALAEFRNSVSVGVVSGLSRSIVAGDDFGNSEQLEGVIQTDAAINPGNSGGPLLDLRGNVIGVNVAVERGAENIGFALPSNIVKGIADSVKQYGAIVRPYLGVRYLTITENLKKKNNLTVDYGVLVSRGESPDELAVVPGSPADKAGIVENDTILEVDGVKLEQSKSLASIIRQKQVGQTIKLKILHKGTEKEVEVTLEKAPKSS